jgi:hypothetical protein
MDTIVNKVRRFFQNNSRLILFNLLLVGIFFPITYQQVIMFSESDYLAHIYMARNLLLTGKLYTAGAALPHPLNAFGMIFFSQVFGLSLEYGEIIVILLSYALLGNVIYSQVKNLTDIREDWKRMIISFGIIIAGPLFLLAGIDHKFYFGYTGFALYHNPTLILLRPFAVLLWVLILKFSFSKINTGMGIFLGILVVILATLAKPSYTICILPAIGLVLIWRKIRGQTINWWFILFGVFIPAIIVLIWQYNLAFLGSRDSGIIIAPFKVIQWMSHKIVIKFLLSIIFPLSVSLLYIKRVIHDRAMMIAWVVFGIGFFYGYFLAEDGFSIYSANFLWSTHITLFILFIQSIIFFLNQKFNGKYNLLPRIILWSVFGGQIVCGIIYYIHCFFNVVYI